MSDAELLTALRAVPLRGSSLTDYEKGFIKYQRNRSSFDSDNKRALARSIIAAHRKREEDTREAGSGVARELTAEELKYMQRWVAFRAKWDAGGECEGCGEPVTDALEFVDHLAREHPDRFKAYKRWIGDVGYRKESA